MNEEPRALHISPDSPQVRAALADISLAVQRALLRGQQYKRARIVLPAPMLVGPTGPTGTRAA